MQENEFESHVQDRINDLKLRPSGAVWSAVEEELQKKKRRRVIFFIFLLAGLGLLGYSGYTLFNTSKSNTSKPELVKQNGNLPTEKQTGTGNDYLQPGIITSSPVNEQADIKTKEVYSDSNTTIVLQKEQKENKILKRNKDVEVETPVAKKKYTAIDKNISDEKPEVQTITQNNYLQQNDVVPQQENPVNSLTGETSIARDNVAKDNLEKEKVSEVLTEKIAGTDTAVTEAVLVQAEKPVVQKQKTISKIIWGLDLSTGMNFSRNNAFSFPSSSLTDRNYTSNPQNSTGNGSGNVMTPPSPVQSGPAFRAGVFAELKLSKRSSLSTGLRYTYLSEKIKVGQFDATFNTSNAYASFEVVNGVYRGTRQTQHTNSYHFIEIPLTYQLQLNKGKKLPVFWNTGISAGYLIGTNALVYDTAFGGIYYKQANEINKMHFSINTGLSFRFGNKNKLQWSLGPDLSLDMTKLMKQDIYTKKRYLLYGGLSVRLFLPEKKK